jgi:hypothetical protein
MKSTFFQVLVLGLFTGFLGAQEPAKQLAKIDASAELHAVKVPYDAAAESLSSDYRKWLGAADTWYVGELDKLQAARAKLGDLDGALASKSERDRIAASTATTPEQLQAMPAPLRQLRTSYDSAVKRATDERARRSDMLRRKYLADLEALQKRVTMTEDIEQALIVKTEKERFRAEIAAGSSVTAAPAPPVPPVAIAKPAASPAFIPAGTRLAQKMTVYVSGCNYGTLHVNGREVVKFVRDKAAMVPLALREGDVIAAKLAIPLAANSLWLSCIASTGEFLFETDVQWINYIPADKENWSDIKNVKEQVSAELAPDVYQSAGHVKRAAAATPLYRDAQPIRGSLSDEPKAVYFHHVVTKSDLVPKKDRKLKKGGG